MEVLQTNLAWRIHFLPLQELSLHGNPLEALPEELGCLTNLQRLQLSACGLPKLPDSVCALTKLEVILISIPPSAQYSSQGPLQSLQSLMPRFRWCSETALGSGLLDAANADTNILQE